MRAADERRPAADLLATDAIVAQRLTLARLDACFRRRRVPDSRAGGHRAARRHRPGDRAMSATGAMSAPGAFIRSGKVRDLYAVDADRLLLVASDRISAFDVSCRRRSPTRGRC